MNGMFSLPPAPPPYPMDAFPIVVREAGFELMRNVQAPDALIGMGLISAISLACQSVIDVKLPTGQVRPTSQNLLIVAESGERKSTVYSMLHKPFSEWDSTAQRALGAKMAQYQIELDVWQAKNKGIRRSISKLVSKGESTDEMDWQLAAQTEAKPIKPRLRYFLRQDMTAKAIMEALEGDGESIAITTDEGHVLFQSAAMSHLGLLNRLWDSPEVLPLDRAGREQIMAMNPRVSVSIMSQPAPLKAYMKKRGAVAKGSGHWARYLVGWPASKKGFRWVNTNELVWECLPKFHERIRELLELYRSMIESGHVKRESLEFSDDAKSRWFDLAVQTEQMLRQGEYLSDIDDFASKLMEILGRLAAALQYFGGEGGKITLDTLERAFTLVRWHLDEFKHLFSPQFVMPQDQVDAHAVVKYLRTRIWLGPSSDTIVAKNHVLHSGPVRDRARLNAALGLIELWGGVLVGVAPKDKKSYVRLLNPYFGSIAV
ncbi:YfjI family protein [Thermomonas aquatica]|uniref:DUF3987 domain-containing protein n=1 Tax=Thermomonas aquatica TaxID=2202149 RepID=A0A5B7ZR09_9GAMM|nr:YfjI family protein [Thermomonas aquatica]QDA57209.1 DUF3987 domain-containing protein [Thermomonas aquatica]